MTLESNARSQHNDCVLQACNDKVTFLQETQLPARGVGRLLRRFLGPANDDADFGGVGTLGYSHKEMLAVGGDVVTLRPRFFDS